MKILALDQSSKISGFAIFKDGKLIDYGRFNFVNADLGKRLERIREKVISLVSENKIDKVILEDIQLESTVNNNVAVYKVLSEVIGVITETLTELRTPYELVYPNTWRKLLSIKGYQRKECKANAQLYVKNNFNIIADEDTCDAICIGASQFVNKQEQKAGFDWS